MHSRTKAAIAAVAITGMAVVGTDAVTYAGTGDSLILGKFNKTGRTTHLKSTGTGPALSLHAKGKLPALAVDSKAKVLKLNADRVDGKNARSLQTRALVFTRSKGLVEADTVGIMRTSRIPRGTYLVSYSVTMDGSINAEYGRCSMHGEKSGFAVPASDTPNGIHDIDLSASSVITTKSQPWKLVCHTVRDEGYGEWTVDPHRPVRVSFLRIDAKRSGPLGLRQAAPQTREGGNS
jgi:hypothetical protein